MRLQNVESRIGRPVNATVASDERDGRGEQKREDEQDAAMLAAAAAQARVPGGEQPLELELVPARVPAPLRPSSVTALVSCHRRHCA